ncbi:hypothetical protein K4K61_000020 [Colletotrichum sp. SAR11_59]|nr:hypothetical protein K4K61_000020 [Colletotrichum sp. SAR11_59]
MASPPSASVFNLRPELEPALPDVAEDNQVKTSEKDMGYRKKRNRARKDEYLNKQRARTIARKRNGEFVLSGARAALPARVSKENRSTYKLVKSMLLLTTTINDGFAVGFAFRDSDFMHDAEAESLCGALQLQGSQALDTARIQGFALILMKSCNQCYYDYRGPKGENGDFFKAVKGIIHERGVMGGGLHPKTHSMKAIIASACEAMLTLFVNGRKAYLRDLVDGMEEQEGVYTNNTRKLIDLVDGWIEWTEDADIEEEKLVDALDDVDVERER